MTEPLDLNALEVVARAATPGPWTINWETDEYHAGMPDRWALSINGPEASEFADLDSADAEHIAAFDPPTVLALIARLREAETRAENGPCWDEGFTIPVPRGGCAPMPPLCTLKAGHLGAHQAGGATWTRRPAADVERKLREAEHVIATAREELRAASIPHGLPKAIYYQTFMVRADMTLAAYEPTNQEGESDER